jgi:hypothetical protein
VLQSYLESFPFSVAPGHRIFVFFWILTPSDEGMLSAHALGARCSVLLDCGPRIVCTACCIHWVRVIIQGIQVCAVYRAALGCRSFPSPLHRPQPATANKLIGDGPEVPAVLTAGRVLATAAPPPLAPLVGNT